MRKKLSLVCVVALLVVGPAMASGAVDSGSVVSTAPDPDLVNQVLNLSASTVVTLEVPDTPGQAITIALPIEGVEYTLDLRPHSVRAPGYQLLVQIEDGSIVQAKPGIVRTLRGTLAEVPGSIVAGSLLESGLKARIVFPDDSGSYWVERLAAHFSDADENLYVVYHDDDKLPSDSRCGNDGSLEIDGHEHGGQASGRGAACGTGLCTAELGIDADFEYFQDHGSSVPNTEAQIEAVINTMNVQYETETDITHLITAIIVRTSEPDPYSSSNYFTLLVQFRNEWLNNQGGIPRDAAQLFTGKDLGGVIGVAWDIGVICTTGAYCLVVSDFNGSFSCATDLSAHEMGHLWDADHCSCPNNTMYAFITCANDFHDTFTVPEIIAHRDSRTCLDGDGGGGGPENDLCADAFGISDGVTGFTTVGANTDGPALPSSCEEGFGLSLVSDVWYDYTATCTGTLTVSTCSDADYDTRLAMYDGFGCTGSLVECNDDGAGCSGFTSEMTASVTSGDQLKIRVGGFDGSGTGNLTITCDDDGGGGIPCGDIFNFQAGCTNSGKLRMRVIMTDFSHDGETVTFTIDGDPVVRPIHGRAARYRILGQGGTGEHTIELTDPAGCVEPIIAFCN
ncbi:MAG: hypothetical protein IH988_08725 [Planctomycetes bacterium]|nr:hypothetical protein [Planctomycetota bacterium]